MRLKEKITETAEKMYDLARDGKYDVKLAMFSKKGNSKSSGIHIISTRSTAHTKKWHAKNR